MPHISEIRWHSIGLLFAASLCIAIGGIHFHVVGAMMEPLNRAYGWERGDVAFALTIFAFLNPLTTIIVGLLADKYGPRAIALPGIVGFCIGLGLIGLAGPALWTWYAAYIAFTILGLGASSVVWTMAIVQHFDKRRGLALAISLAGSGVLVSLTPAIVLWLDTKFGVRGIYPAFAVGALFVMLLPAWLFLPREAQGVEKKQIIPGPPKAHWRDIVRSGHLWRLGFGLLIIASCIGTFIVHFQPMLIDQGFTREDAAYVAIFVGPAMVTGRIVTGMLFDHLPTRLVAVVAFSLPGIACLLLYGLTLDSTTAVFLAILIGLGMGSEVDVVAYLSSRYFGTRNYGLVFGILISIYGLAVGTSSWVAGKVYDATSSYDNILIGLAVGVVAAMLLVLSMGPPPEVEPVST